MKVLINARATVVILIILGLMIFSAGYKNAPFIQADRPIKLGMLRIEDNLPFFVAEHDGIYAKYGLRVELITFNSARERDIALQAGETDGELADLVAVALLKKGGTPVKAVSLGLGATVEEGRFVLLSAPQSGITEPHQLADVPIAVSQNTIISYLAEKMLKEKGLSITGIRLQNIPDINIRLAALLAGTDVKAALLPDPLATLAEKAGAHVVIDDSKLEINLSQTVILFSEETLLKRPDAVKKILAAYGEAANFLNQDPKKYKSLIIDKARIPAALEDSYTIPRFSKLQLPSTAMVERIMNWMNEKNLLEKSYPYEAIVSTSTFIP